MLPMLWAFASTYCPFVLGFGSYMQSVCVCVWAELRMNCVGEEIMMPTPWAWLVFVLMMPIFWGHTYLDILLCLQRSDIMLPMLWAFASTYCPFVLGFGSYMQSVCVCVGRIEDELCGGGNHDAHPLGLAIERSMR